MPEEGLWLLLPDLSGARSVLSTLPVPKLYRVGALRSPCVCLAVFLVFDTGKFRLPAFQGRSFRFSLHRQNNKPFRQRVQKVFIRTKSRITADPAGWKFLTGLGDEFKTDFLFGLKWKVFWNQVLLTQVLVVIRKTFFRHMQLAINQTVALFTGISGKDSGVGSCPPCPDDRSTACLLQRIFCLFWETQRRQQ